MVNTKKQKLFELSGNVLHPFSILIEPTQGLIGNECLYLYVSLRFTCDEKICAREIARSRR
jgi:hypothetical protein